MTASAPGFAAIDCGTTGVFPGGHDHMIEIAVVHVGLLSVQLTFDSSE